MIRVRIVSQCIERQNKWIARAIVISSDFEQKKNTEIARLEGTSGDVRTEE